MVEIKYKIGDCLELMKELPNNSIDLIFTSPPYNVGIDYGIYGDNLPWEDYLNAMRDRIIEFYRVLKNNGRVCLNVLINAKPKNDDVRHPYVDFINILRGAGFKIMGTPLWYDNTHVKFTAWGSWLSASAPFFYCPHEILILGCKGDWKRMPGIDTVKKEAFMNLAFGKFRPAKRDNGHPAPFSLEMAMTVIECLTFKEDNVLDPFVGQGTTLLACRMTDRNGMGYEINPGFESIIKKYILDAIPQIETYEDDMPESCLDESDVKLDPLGRCR